MKEHSICITYNYSREDNTGHWVWVTDLGDVWEFLYAEGARSGRYHVAKSRGFSALMKECRYYFDKTAWIYNDHANRRHV